MPRAGACLCLSERDAMKGNVLAGRLRLAGGLALVLMTACAAPARAPAAGATAAGASAAGTAGSAAPAPAGEAAAAPPALAVRVMHNAVAGSQALLQVIQDAGLFTQHGLAVEIGNATPRATTAALLAGDVPLMVSSGIHAVSAGLA